MSDESGTPSEPDLWNELVHARIARASALLRSAGLFAAMARRHGVVVPQERRDAVERTLADLIDAADAVDASFMGLARELAVRQSLRGSVPDA